jgi:hypothetical protein
MRHLTLMVVGCACLYAVAALSDTSRNVVPANCRDKQRVRMLSAGEPLAGDPDKVRCTVKYWVCGQDFTQSQVAPNQSDACAQFTSAVRSKLGGEACCDCFPKCAATDSGQRRTPAPNAGTQPAKADCCGKVEPLEERVKQLEARLKALEDKLSGDEVTLNVAGSSIKLKSDKTGSGVFIVSDHEISIGSSKDISIASGKNVSIKAGGNIVMKGARIQQN